MKTKLSILVSFLAVFVVSTFAQSGLIGPQLVYADAADDKLASEAEKKCSELNVKDPNQLCPEAYLFGHGTSKESDLKLVCDGVDNDGRNSKITTDRSKDQLDACRKGARAGFEAKNDKVSAKNAVIPEADKKYANGRACSGYVDQIGATYTTSTFAVCVRAYKKAFTAKASQTADQICNYSNSDPRQAACVKGASQAITDYNNRSGGSSSGGTGEANVKDDDGGDGGGSGAEGDAKDQVDCDASGVILSWIICPIVDLGANFSDFAFQNLISPLLEDIPVSADPKSGTYEAWTSFRIIANVLLVGTLLVIVYSQARGGK